MTVLSQIEAVFAPYGFEIGFSATHLQTNTTVAINPGTLFPTASVFKVPVMVEVFRQADEGRFSLADRLPMPDSQRTIGSGVMQKLAAGLAPTIRDLVMLMIIISDNTATDMLLERVGAANVTATMRRLGLANIHVAMSLKRLFAHTFGLSLDTLPDYPEMQRAMRTTAMDYGSLAFAGSPENVTSTAADMAGLMALIAQNRAGSTAACADMLTILRAQQLRDRVPRYLPIAGVANKTGTFRGIRNDAGLILRGEADTIAFALFTFDRTEFPVENARPLAERNALVNGAMADVGEILWQSFGR